MPKAIGLVYCTVHQVYILAEDSADPVYLRIPIYLLLLVSGSELTRWSEKPYVVLVRMHRYYCCHTHQKGAHKEKRQRQKTNEL